MEGILTNQMPILCESTDKFVSNYKLAVSNNEAILTYWPVKNTFFMFYRLESATFKLLNHLNQISLLSYKNICMVSL